jgi:D-glycero-D-manno-heptose 1,7-bisphosphate phosphatase
LFQAQRELHLDLSRTLFVGDDPRDREAAERAGCLFQEVSGEKPLIAWVQSMVSREAISRGTQDHAEKTIDYRP